MSHTYEVRAKVDQIVTREIHLTVTATSSEQAEDYARLALQEYPKAVNDLPAVKRIVTAKQTFWIPKSVELTSTTEEKENKNAS